MSGNCSACERGTCVHVGKHQGRDGDDEVQLQAAQRRGEVWWDMSRCLGFRSVCLLPVRPRPAQGPWLTVMSMLRMKVPIPGIHSFSSTLLLVCVPYMDAPKKPASR